MLLQYDSDDSSTNSEKDYVELGSREVRQVYLVTYSQADTVKFPTRASFAKAVVESFSQRCATVMHWCCCQEEHKKSGVHYHICVKLDRTQRWMSSKKFLKEKHSISVHFSTIHANYYTAWKYVTKEDGNFEQSNNNFQI